MDQLFCESEMLSRRGIDQTWVEEKVLPQDFMGFAPHLGKVFYGKSVAESWLKHPRVSARPFNEQDRLVKQALFLLHDYLHCWAYLAINELMPTIGLGYKPITRKNAENLAFCHLITEAVATVGLDYWFLGVHDINSFCDLGSEVKCLTVSYSVDNEDEYRRFLPGFTAQVPSFFGSVCEWYCLGKISGANGRSFATSPMTGGWLSKELTYGVRQREYTRRWLSHLSKEGSVFEVKDCAAPMKIDAPWKKRLIHDLGELLWEKVKLDKRHKMKRRYDPSEAWKAPSGRAVDFRFSNLNSFGPDFLPQRELDAENFEFYFYQAVSALDFEAFDSELIKLFPVLKQSRDAKLVKSLFSRFDRIEGDGPEPRDLFMLG